MKIIFTLAMALASIYTTPASAQSAAVKRKTSGRPNVILILADDLGYGDLSSFGNPAWKTPNIDRLAAEGAKLTHFYTPTPYCAPTRASLLTGRYPARHGLILNPNPEKVNNSFQTFRGGDDLGIGDDQLLLSELFKASGYATAIVGKWHLGHKPPFYPTRHGFDAYYGIPYSNDMRPVLLMKNDSVVEYPVVQTTLTKRYTSYATDYIEQHKDKPFFLYLAHAMPHKPLTASEEFYTPATKDDLYADAMRELDWSIGEVMKKLTSAGLDDNTLVIFVSDNGPWFGGNTGGLRGIKSQNWEGGIRVPFIARWKGTIPAGQVSAQPAGVIDVLPTLARVARLPLPKDHVLDGKDIFALFTSPAATPHEALFSFYNDQLQTVRSGKWKLHLRSPESAKLPDDASWIDPRLPDGVTILAPFEQPKANEFPGVKTGVKAAAGLLFDLEADPSEQHDVAGEHPDVVKRLTALARNYRFK